MLQETATTLEHAFELLAQYSLQAYSMDCMETYLDAQEIHVIMNGNHQVDQETLLTYGTKTIKESDTWFYQEAKGTSPCVRSRRVRIVEVRNMGVTVSNI